MLWWSLALLLCLVWAVIMVAAYLGLRTMPSLSRLPRPAEGAESRRLSVVLAARDEASRVGQCLASLLAQDHADLEIIAVDDRSRDATGRIMDDLAAQSAGRLIAVHVTELPEGWLGKCHGLHVGATRATGEFILFTDADVVFERTALSRALTHLLRERADMLTAYPGLIMPDVWERVITLAFAVVFLLGAHPGLAQREGTSVYMGSGAFNLVRRSVYEAGGGHGALRLEVLDDMRLGRLIKRAGGRIRAVAGRGMLTVRWQETLWGHIRGLEKNIFASLDYSVARTTALMALMAVLHVWPVAGLAVGPWPARALCAVTWLLVLPAGAWISRRFTGMGPLMGLTLPIGGVLMVVALGRSMLVTLRRGGVRWRDSFYPLERLRAFGRDTERAWRQTRQARRARRRGAARS